MKTILPTTDRIAILPVLDEEKTAGLEIVRDHRNTEMQHGVVIAAGPQSPIKQGKHVLFNPAAGTMLRRLNDKNGKWEEIRIMHADSVQCLLSDE